MIGLSEMLKARGFEPNPNRVKLVRHTKAQIGAELLQSPWLDYYQKYQSKPIFDGCDQIIVFVGEERSNSRFIGVYEVGKGMTADEAPPLPAECPRPEWAQGGVYYPQEKRGGFEDLEGRLIIDWGKDPINWYKRFTDLPVIEIRAPGRTLPPSREYAGVDSRGGFETPVEREIARTPPSPSRETSKTPDPEARRVQMERRNKAHYKLIRAFADKAEGAGLRCTCTQFADALCQSSIFEMKSIENDEVSQVRAAIGQLYHYLFMHRNRSGFERAALYAVFDKVISPELDTFLREVARVGVIVFDGVRFSSDEATVERLSWLFS
jgi:hypothetical protein